MENFQPPSTPSRPVSFWWYVGAIIALLALGAWYYYTHAPGIGANGSAASEPSAADQTQAPPLTSGTANADIQADLDQTPDSASALNADANASGQEVQNF